VGLCSLGHEHGGSARAGLGGTRWVAKARNWGLSIRRQYVLRLLWVSFADYDLVRVGKKFCDR
jgi:hypothetical protein